jgi:hypothetical protein
MIRKNKLRLHIDEKIEERETSRRRNAISKEADERRAQRQAQAVPVMPPLEATYKPSLNVKLSVFCCTRCVMPLVQHVNQRFDKIERRRVRREKAMVVVDDQQSVA